MLHFTHVGVKAIIKIHSSPIKLKFMTLKGSTHHFYLIQYLVVGFEALDSPAAGDDWYHFVILCALSLVNLYNSQHNCPQLQCE